MDSPITFPEVHESGIPKLKELLRNMNTPVPSDVEKPDVQAQCNQLIRTYFTDRKASITEK